MTTESVTSIATSNRRASRRITVPGLKVGIRKTSLAKFGWFTTCVLMDINKSGIAVVTDVLHLDPMQQVAMRLAYESHNYFATGAVGYRHKRKNVVQYGITFVHVPYELEQFIGFLVDQPLIARSRAAEQTNPPANEIEIIPGTQRRLEPRFEATGIELRVRKTRLLRYPDYVSCKPIDIGRGGISFTSNLFRHNLMGKVEVEISYNGQREVATGIISYCHPQAESLHYGVEFTKVTPGFTSLIEGYLNQKLRSDGISQ